MLTGWYPNKTYLEKLTQTIRTDIYIYYLYLWIFHMSVYLHKTQIPDRDEICQGNALPYARWSPIRMQFGVLMIHVFWGCMHLRMYTPG